MTDIKALIGTLKELGEKATPEPWDYDDHSAYDEDDDVFDDCALNMTTGQCGHAGSEMCDFECPLRDSEFFAGNPGSRLRRKRKSHP